MKKSALLIVLLAALAPGLRADFGDGGDYSGGSSDGSSSGGSDWGGSSSSSSDWGSSSGSDYSSGGGGGGGSPFDSWVGTLFVVIIIGFVVVTSIRNASRKRPGYVARLPLAPQPDWAAAIRAQDPNFSRVLFMDFANLVFVKFHEARGKQGKREMILPYLAPDLRQEAMNDSTQADGVVVGGRYVEWSDVQNGRARVSVMFRANVFEISGGTRMRTYVEHALVFYAPASYQTPEPDKLMALGCPACGNPEELALDGRCKSCGVTADGSRGWMVVGSHVRKREMRGPEQRRIGHFNKGLDLRTLVDPNLGAAMRELSVRDAAFSIEACRQRAAHIFRQLQEGWAARDIAKLRPYLSDGLFNCVRYALTRNDELRLAHVIGDIDIYRIEVARIEHDAYFDAVTVRIFCRMMDYALDAHGELFKGDNKNKRDYSEYWTFLRRSGVSGAHEPANCPSCGAPLDKINMAGVCGYCNAKIVSGNFDWVLAQIDQDEEYRG